MQHSGKSINLIPIITTPGLTNQKRRRIDRGHHRPEKQRSGHCTNIARREYVVQSAAGHGNVFLFRRAQPLGATFQPGGCTDRV